jgi:hypothetical protein
LTLSAPAGNSVWVSYSTANGTATEGQDYVAEWGTVYFATGQTTATISIDVKGEKTKEPNETFFVNLSSNSLVVIADGQGQGTVLDDDSSNPGKGPGQGHGNPNGTAAKTIPAKNSATSSGARSSSTIDSALAAWLAGTFTSPRRRK